MSLRDVAGLGEEQCHRLLGRREDVRLGRVDDHHASLGGRRDVDVVESDTGPTDNDQLGPCLQHRAVDLRSRSDDQRLGAVDQ